MVRYCEIGRRLKEIDLATRKQLQICMNLQYQALLYRLMGRGIAAFSEGGSHAPRLVRASEKYEKSTRTLQQSSSRRHVVCDAALHRRAEFAKGYEFS